MLFPMPKGTQMTEFNSDENLSAHDIKRHYGVALGEAERIINWFSPSTNEVERCCMREAGRSAT
jgi:hypothetical protein